MSKNLPKLPHSWAVDEWPPDVYPRTASKARYLLRAHRDELIAAGALSRVGRDLVILGAGYAAWLTKNMGRVRDFSIAPNRVRGAFSHADATAEREQ